MLWRALATVCGSCLHLKPVKHDEKWTEKVAQNVLEWLFYLVFEPQLTCPQQGMEEEPGRLRARALCLKWQALLGEVELR